MTDRHAGYIVVLAYNVREDETESVLAAIRMIKNVQSVKPIVADVELTIAEERVKLQILEKIAALVKEERGS